MNANDVFANFTAKDSVPPVAPETPVAPDQEVLLMSHFASPVADHESFSQGIAKAEDKAARTELAEVARAREMAADSESMLAEITEAMLTSIDVPVCEWSDLLLRFADAASKVGEDIRTEAGVARAVEIAMFEKIEVMRLVYYLDAGLVAFLSLHPESGPVLAAKLTREGRVQAMEEFLFSRTALNDFIFFFKMIEARELTSVDAPNGYVGTTTGRIIVGAAMVLIELEAFSVIQTVNAAVFRAEFVHKLTTTVSPDNLAADILSSSSRELAADSTAALAETPEAVVAEEAAAPSQDHAEPAADVESEAAAEAALAVQVAKAAEAASHAAVELAEASEAAAVASTSSAPAVAESTDARQSSSPICVFGGYSYDNRGLPPFARVADSAEAVGRDLAFATLAVAHPRHDAVTAAPGVDIAAYHSVFNMLTFFSGISMSYGDVDTTRVSSMRLGLEEPFGAAGVVANAERLYHDVAFLNKRRVQAVHNLYLNNLARSERDENSRASIELARILSRGERPSDIGMLHNDPGMAASAGAHVGVKQAGIRTRQETRRPMITDFENTEHGEYLMAKADDNVVLASATSYATILAAMQKAEYEFFKTMARLNEAAVLARASPSAENNLVLQALRSRIVEIRSLYIDHAVAYALFLAAHVYDDHTETTLRV